MTLMNEVLHQRLLTFTAAYIQNVLHPESIHLFNLVHIDQVL